MTKTKILKKLSEKIDLLICSGKEKSEEYKRLCVLHKKIKFA